MYLHSEFSRRRAEERDIGQEVRQAGGAQGEGDRRMSREGGGGRRRGDKRDESI